MNDGKGSPIIVVPILLLLLCAGAAALAGIALQPSASEAVTAAPITASDLGTPCATPPGPRPTRPAQVRPWLEEVRSCIDAELAGLPGYTGAGVEGFSRDVLVVRWDGDAPAIVVKRVAIISGDANAAVVGTR